MFLIAGLAHYASSRTNTLGFVQRAKQVARWLTGPRPDHSRPSLHSLPMLERKANELGRQVARGLFQIEGFMLLVFDYGTETDPGYLVHIASVGRREQIKILQKHIDMLKHEQAQHS